MEMHPLSETPIEGEDYYMDGPYVVFTEAYHLKRGYCCGSGCRHCPWRDPRDVNREPGPDRAPR